MQKLFFFVCPLIALITVFPANCLEALDQNEIILYTNDKYESIRIQPIRNTALDIIQFRISCPDCRSDNNCTIHVSNVLNSCTNGVPIDFANKDFIFSLNSSLTIVPEHKYDNFIPYAGCSYNFRSVHLKDTDFNWNINRTLSISPCVDGKCNCNLYNFTFINMTTNLHGDILTFIADADYDNELNVSGVNYTLYCTFGEFHNIINTNTDYHHIVFNVMLKGMSSKHKGSCQIELRYENQKNCGDAYAFWEIQIDEQNNGIYFLVGFCFTILMLIAVIVLKMRIRSADTIQQLKQLFRQTFPNILYMPYIDRLEHDPRQIKIIKIVGQGQFGEVFLAKSNVLYMEYGRVHKYIAVKQLKRDATEQMKADFLKEITLIAKITDFAHVVQLLGYCTKTVPYMLITEFICNADLRSYLKELREQWIMKSQFKPYSGEYIEVNTNSLSERPNTPDTPNSSKYSYCNSGTTNITELNQSPLLEHGGNFDYKLEVILDNHELENFALQIAKGMAHLEAIPIIHRDLAARNILLNECKVLKISDFGLACIGDENAMLRQGDQIPFRWTAPDVFETRIYDMKSDVWSFAVVLWEIGMLGAYPYQEIDDVADLIAYLRDDNNRLERPGICCEDLYELMLRCWIRDSSLRPTFFKLVELLGSKKKRLYEKFEFLNPEYMFPPTEEKD